MDAKTECSTEIRYDRQTRDYAAYVDGVLIGFYGSYHAAEVACNQYTFAALTHQQAA
jgi:hypothetical protein